MDIDINKVLIDFAEPSDTINGKQCKPLIKFEWWFVKEELPELINSGAYQKIIKKCFGFKNYNKQDTINFILWLTNELKNINEMENNVLSSRPDADLLMAGIERLNIFGNTATLESLSSNILDWQKIKKLPYELVFDKLYLNKINSEIQKKYNQNQIDKSKRKR